MRNLSFDEQEINVTTNLIGDFQEIFIKGKMIYGNTEHIKKQLYDVLQPAPGYIINLCNIVKVDSTGCGVLINLAKKIYKEHSKLIIVVEDEIILEMFSISQIHLIMPIVQTVEEAVELLHNGFQSPMVIEEY